MNIISNHRLKPVEGLPQPVDSLDDLAYRVPDPLPKKSFAMYICGQPGSGKSNLWLQMLLSRPTKKKPNQSRYYYKYFDRVYLVSGSLATLPMKRLGLDDDQVFSSYSDESLDSIINLEKKDENHNTLLILDDVIRDLTRSKELSKSILNRRHITQNTQESGQAGFSMLITSQVYNWLPLGLRKNMSHVILFRTENVREKQAIKSELMGDLDETTANMVMNTAWDGNHSFLLILCEKPTEKRYYKNFDLIQIS